MVRPRVVFVAEAEVYSQLVADLHIILEPKVMSACWSMSRSASPAMRPVTARRQARAGSWRKDSPVADKVWGSAVGMIVELEIQEHRIVNGPKLACSHIQTRGNVCRSRSSSSAIEPWYVKSGPLMRFPLPGPVTPVTLKLTGKIKLTEVRRNVRQAGVLVQLDEFVKRPLSQVRTEIAQTARPRSSVGINMWVSLSVTPRYLL